MVGTPSAQSVACSPMVERHNEAKSAAHSPKEQGTTKRRVLPVLPVLNVHNETKSALYLPVSLGES